MGFCSRKIIIQYTVLAQHNSTPIRLVTVDTRCLQALWAEFTVRFAACTLCQSKEHQLYWVQPLETFCLTGKLGNAPLTHVCTGLADGHVGQRPPVIKCCPKNYASSITTVGIKLPLDSCASHNSGVKEQIESKHNRINLFRTKK